MHFLCEQCKHLLGGNRNFPCQCGEYYLTSYIFKVSHNSYPCMHHYQHIPTQILKQFNYMFHVFWFYESLCSPEPLLISQYLNVESSRVGWKATLAKFAPQNFFKSHFMRVAVGQESAIIIIKEKNCKNNPHKCCPKCPFPCSVAIQLVVWKQELDPSLKWEQKAAWWP